MIFLLGGKMSKITEWVRSNKIKVALIGGAVVITSQYFTCTVEPNVQPESVNESEKE